MRRTMALTIVGGMLLGGAATLAMAQSSSTRGNVLTDTKPYDEALLDRGWTAVQDDVRARLSDWSTRVGVSEMASNELVAAMDTITEAISGRGDSEDWLRLRELMARRELLCVELPQEHIYRNGEYCP